LALSPEEENKQIAGQYSREKVSWMGKPVFPLVRGRVSNILLERDRQERECFCDEDAF